MFESISLEIVMNIDGIVSAEQQGMMGNRDAQ